jgi:hypothetical protein
LNSCASRQLFSASFSLNMRAGQPNYGFYGSKQHRAVGRDPSSFYNLDKRSFFGFTNRRAVSVPIEVRKCSHQGVAPLGGGTDIEGLFSDKDGPL